MNTQTDAITVCIVDDEELARERLKRLISTDTNYRVIAEADNGKDAINTIGTMHPDIVLLDIRMPVCDGMEVARVTSELDHPPAIIFCTAYDEYAIQALNHQAIGYLLKPVRGEELFSALAKAKQINQLQLKALQSLNEDKELTFVAHSWSGREVIPFSDIYFFRSDQKYLTVVHRSGETLSDQTLKELEQKYQEQLLRVHRNTLVNTQHIEAMKRDSHGAYYLQLRGNESPIAISRRHVTAVKNWLENIT